MILTETRSLRSPASTARTSSVETIRPASLTISPPTNSPSTKPCDCFPFQRVMTRLARSTISRFMRRMADMGPTCSGAILTTCLRSALQMSSPFSTMSLEHITLEDAKQLLQLPRELGVDPADGEVISPQTGDTAPMSSKAKTSGQSTLKNNY